MLAVQVQYLGVQETIRHNKVAEAQNERALDQADIKIQQNWIALDETRRHNVATETETNRHNVATESLGYANLAFNYASLAETRRHNESTEALQFEYQKEQRRHNIMQEGYQQSQATLQYMGVQEQNRANIARESETLRHDLVAESIGRDQNSISQYRAIVSEAQGWASISNAQEANDINRMNAETQKRRQNLAEQEFEHNKAMNIWHNINDTLGGISNAVQGFWHTTNESIRTIGGLFNEQEKLKLQRERN